MDTTGSKIKATDCFLIFAGVGEDISSYNLFFYHLIFYDQFYNKT